MIRHLLKLVWNRKHANALVIVEILFSFLVVFIVSTLTLALAMSWRRPLGYEWRDVWVVNVDFPNQDDDLLREQSRSNLQRLLREARSFPEVVAAAGSATPAYGFSTRIGSWKVNGKQIDSQTDIATDGFDSVMKVKMLYGRWFNQDDEAGNLHPIVVDSDLARAAYDTDDVVGRIFDFGDKHAVYKVVGVVAPFRAHGELTRSAVDMSFFRSPLEKADQLMAPQNIVIRVRPGTTEAFEAALASRIHQAAPDLSFRILRMQQMRTKMLGLRLAPVMIGGVVALFLIAMVTLGMTGVLWQNVTSRTREIGLRRALGATPGGVRAQVLAEVVALASMALVLGLAVALQLPLLGALRWFVLWTWVTPAAFAAGLVLSVAIIYGITILCGLYPSWLASRVEPAEALRHE